MAPTNYTFPKYNPFLFSNKLFVTQVFKSQSVSQFHGTMWGLLLNDFSPSNLYTESTICIFQVLEWNITIYHVWLINQYLEIISRLQILLYHCSYEDCIFISIVILTRYTSANWITLDQHFQLRIVNRKLLIFIFDMGQIKPAEALKRLNKNYIFDIIILFVLLYYLLYLYYIHAKSISTQNLRDNILTKMLIGICFCPFE